MCNDLVLPILFGTVGLVDLQGKRSSLHNDLQDLTNGFESTSETVSIMWYGDGIAAATFQHAEDALARPGRYEVQVPEAGSYQGILQGHFFAGFGKTPETALRPSRLSHEMVSRYADQGLKSLCRLNGAWHAVVLDKERQNAVFARDAVGVETLYVVPSDTRLAFASDLRILRAAGLIGKHDEQAILEFLHFLYVPSPRTVYSDVASVLPGHALFVEPQRTHQERFAPPRFVQGVSLGHEATVQSAVEDHLPSFEERVLSAAESCVPERGRVGLLLSAGKDSAALALAVKEVAPDRVVALTVGSPDPRFDESDYAIQMCDFLGIPHSTYTPDSDELVPGFLEMMACQDQPMGDPASLPLFLALRHMPEDVSVIWDGTGNDYYFGSVRAADRYRYLQQERFMRIIPRFAWSLFLRVMQLGPARFASTARDWQTPLEEAFVSWHGWTREELAQLTQEDVDWSDTHLVSLIRTNADKGWTALQTEVFGAVWTPNAAFRKTLSAARESGHAVRMPWVDNRLAEYVNGLPQELQFRDCVNKVLLRSYLLEKLPEDLARKPKGSFVFDQNLLLRSREDALLHWLRESGLPRSFPAWSHAYVAEMLTAYFARPNQYVDKIYALILLTLWISMYRGQLERDSICGS